jgi:uncharacterized membrane protein YbaN (DUF454 family)
MTTTSTTDSPGLRDRVRSRRATRHPYRVAVFLLGLMCMALGVALMALPGPLTIPPVLLGLWIWSTEFRFAERFFDSFQEKAKEAWSQAKRKPKRAAAVTGSGLVMAAVAFWAVGHFNLVDRIREALPV